MLGRLHLIPLLLLAASTALGDKTAQAGEPIRCNCLFAQSSGYTGVGTRAVCSAMSHKNVRGPGEACEIAFGSAVTEGPPVAKLNLDPVKYREAGFQLTQQNLTAVQNRNPQAIANAAFLRDAIPAYMRAVYLRADVGIEGEALNQLDKEVRDISSEYASQIADVFLGKQTPFDVAWRGPNHLFVEVGAVRFVYVGQSGPINLAAVFFDPSDRQ